MRRECECVTLAGDETTIPCMQWDGCTYDTPLERERVTTYLLGRTRGVVSPANVKNTRKKIL